MRIILRAAAASALCLCLASVPAFAQAPHVRGTIEALNGDRLTLKTEGGGTETIELAPNWNVTVLKRIGLHSILGFEQMRVSTPPLVSISTTSLKGLRHDHCIQLYFSSRRPPRLGDRLYFWHWSVDRHGPSPRRRHCRGLGPQ